MSRRPISAGLLVVLLVLGGAAFGTGVVSAEDPQRTEYLVDLAPIESDAAGNVTALQAHANETQSPIIAHIERNASVRVEERFWLANALLISVESEADLALLEDTAHVRRISPHEPVTVTQPRGTVGSAEEIQTDALAQIGVPEVWETFGTRGAGTTVAILDTGVDPNHPDIRVDGWRDFNDDPALSPKDYGRHGTHVAGTLIGGDTSGTRIGIAPEAEALHGAVLTDCSSFECEGDMADVLDGMEWAVEEEADVISMSLGGEGYEPAAIEAVQNAHAAGTIVVAASGNEGSDTSTSPGNVYEAITVGAVDRHGELAAFSSNEEIETRQAWGDDAPAHWPDTYGVPDVVAPGVDIYSAEPGGGYRTASGTSMATPHVSGMLLLAKSVAGDRLSTEELAETLYGTTAASDSSTGQGYGHGIVDARAFTKEAAGWGTIEGTVTDTVTGEPIPEATVTIGETTVEAGNDGAFEHFGVEGDETHRITVTAPGYEAHEEPIAVPANDVDSVDVALSGDAAIDLSVFDGHFEAPVDGATIEATGERGTYSGHAVGDGTYTIADVPGGHTYDVTVQRDGFLTKSTELQVPVGVHVEIEPVLEGNASIEVTTRDGVTDTPVAAAVSVHREDGATFHAGRTDENGERTIRLPGTGASYRLETSAAGYEMAHATTSLDSGQSDAQSLALRGDADIRLDLRDGTFDTPIEEATVRLVGERGTYPGTSARIPAVPSQTTYELEIEAAGYEPLTRSIRVEEPGAWNETIELAGNARLRIHTSDGTEPIEGATVALEAQDGTWVEISEHTDADGRLDVAVPGTGASYAVRVDANGFAGNETTTAPVEGGDRTEIDLRLTAAEAGMPGPGIVVAIVACIAGAGVLLRRNR